MRWLVIGHVNDEAQEVWFGQAEDEKAAVAAAERTAVRDYYERLARDNEETPETEPTYSPDFIIASASPMTIY